MNEIVDYWRCNKAKGLIIISLISKRILIKSIEVFLLSMFNEKWIKWINGKPRCLGPSDERTDLVPQIRIKYLTE